MRTTHNYVRKGFVALMAGVVAAAIATFSPVGASAAESTNLTPHIEIHGDAAQLFVDGNPYLVLGGELRNSSSSSLDYLNQTVWPSLDQMTGLNTVLAAVTWEQIEPEQGRFDFSTVDGLIQQARDHGVHLALLWFGSWKNGNSDYAPGWVKSNETTYPLVQAPDGQHLAILSPLSTANRDADAAAFAALMAHVNQVDAAQSTVIMIQLENEMGVLGSTRDNSALGNQLWAQNVPTELMAYLTAHKGSLREPVETAWASTGYRASGTWEQVFGDSPTAGEVFMAWYYASFTNTVASAGKAAYNIPMYVNAWIVQPTDLVAGDYPSGGPQERMFDVWQVAAPNVDIFAPDIYLTNFMDVLSSYSLLPNKALFVPESGAGSTGAANAFGAIGLGTIGYSPFGVESATTTAPGPFASAYQALSAMSPLILQGQRDGSMKAVSLRGDATSADLVFGDIVVHIDERAEPGYALVVQTGPTDFVVAGASVYVTFQHASQSNVGLCTVQEGTFDQGVWEPGRWLNGDDVVVSYGAVTRSQELTITGLKFSATSASIQRTSVYTFGDNDTVPVNCSVPISVPASSATPTTGPTSSAPTTGPTSSAPTSGPTSSGPTTGPTNSAPTSSASTSSAPVLNPSSGANVQNPPKAAVAATVTTGGTAVPGESPWGLVGLFSILAVAGSFAVRRLVRRS